ncbi:MAG: glycosyltransferase [Desulfobacterales bacterium]|nr:glycosyltransferase [Desulfobacteraceae bacterium]MBT7086737.1 glycosyltransferase [Desulfobacterales bacterium]
MKEKVYILLPVYNRRKTTELFIQSLQAQTYTNYCLLLIDDGSTDGTEEMVRDKIENLIVLKGNGKWWWAGSLQKGLDWLQQNRVPKEAIILFINDDVTFNKFFLENALNIIYKKGAGSLLLAQTIDEKAGCPVESGVEANLHNMKFKIASTPEKINCLSTRGLFMKYSDLLRIGKFHTLILPHYWSDYEFTIRAKKKKLHLYTDKTLAIHIDKQQTGFHDFNNERFIIFIANLFSKKSIPNPIYKSTFIMLTAAKKNIPLLLTKTWLNFILMIFIKLKSTSFSFIKEQSLKKALSRYDNSNMHVIIGAGNSKQSGWINTNYPIIDITREQTLRNYFKPDSVSAFLAEHVWEHLDENEAEIALQNCFKYLKTKGHIRIAVPDGYQTDQDYIHTVKPGGTGSGADDHKILFNYQTLSELMVKNGFKVKLLEWFDEDGKFHQRDWLLDDGFIHRSARFDKRNTYSATTYTSLIIDGIKP